MQLPGTYKISIKGTYELSAEYPVDGGDWGATLFWFNQGHLICSVTAHKQSMESVVNALHDSMAEVQIGLLCNPQVFFVAKESGVRYQDIEFVPKDLDWPS